VDDQNFMMTVTSLKNTFKIHLKNLYPISEIENFFFQLIEHKIGLKRIDLALDPNQELTSDNELYFSDALTQLKKEIPLQYIIGETEFYGLPFNVNKNVLIPRPETEELVSWIIADAKHHSEKIKILDIGTGSGCIAISLAKNIPNAEVWALDISNKAIKTAQENALLNKVKIQFINKNILILDKLNIEFDIIVSNPPYVRELEKIEIKNNVLDNEPHLALFVKDQNPLLFYDKICDFSKNNLVSQGSLFFEINQYLGKETKGLLEEKGLSNIELRKDVFNNDRMIKAINS
jgi:release factor glutamine methyltransferase